MSLESLGYIGIQSDRLDDWSCLSTGLLGMQEVDKARSSRAFRMDDRSQRLIVTRDSHEGLGYLGWEVETEADLDTIADRVENYGIRVIRAPASLADQRLVQSLIWFEDPVRNRHEVFCKPMLADTPFVPGRPISGFKTGALGMGHAVLHVENVTSLLPFYTDVLGFAVTDFGRTPYQLYFFHLNNRHHSFAMVGSGRRGLHHFMVELGSLDDVGQGYDLAQLEENRVAYTLGRHTNDYMTSFYAHTPSGFFVEYGWGARIIDPEIWVPQETFDGPSFWGHERLYMEEGPRKRLRDMRLDAARRGVRASLRAECPWLDSIINQE